MESETAHTFVALRIKRPKEKSDEIISLICAHKHRQSPLINLENDFDAYVLLTNNKIAF